LFFNTKNISKFGISKSLTESRNSSTLELDKIGFVGNDKMKGD
jgi:hypothetical protein